MSKTIEFIQLTPTAKLPVRGSELSSGFDFYYDNVKKLYDAEIIDDTSLVIKSLGRVLIGTGLAINLDSDEELQIRPRSGLALKEGITILNTPGTIDADYKDEIGIILVNVSNVPYHLNLDERIAQGVIAKVERKDPIWSTELKGEDRGGGFGHTGNK